MREKDFESRSHITKHLTGNEFQVIRERSRVNSWEEQDYLAWKEFLAETLNVDFYRLGVAIHMGLKISKDGLSREEDVLVLQGMYEKERPFNTGFPLIEALEEQQRKEKPQGRFRRLKESLQ